MEILAQKWHEKFERGEEVNCPKKDCSGLLAQVSVKKFEQYTEIYWEKTNFYRCNETSNHVWKYSFDSFKDSKF